jgi:hypothetical protein
MATKKITLTELRHLVKKIIKEENDYSSLKNEYLKIKSKLMELGVDPDEINDDEFTPDTQTHRERTHSDRFDYCREMYEKGKFDYEQYLECKQGA